MNTHTALLAIGGTGTFGDSPLDTAIAWGIVALLVAATALIVVSSWRATHHHGGS
jgi:hypothetical protein